MTPGLHTEVGGGFTHTIAICLLDNLVTFGMLGRTIALTTVFLYLSLPPLFVLLSSFLCHYQINVVREITSALWVS